MKFYKIHLKLCNIINDYSYKTLLNILDLHKQFRRVVNERNVLRVKF